MQLVLSIKQHKTFYVTSYWDLSVSKVSCTPQKNIIILCASWFQRRCVWDLHRVEISTVGSVHSVRPYSRFYRHDVTSWKNCSIWRENWRGAKKQNYSSESENVWFSKTTSRSYLSNCYPPLVIMVAPDVKALRTTGSYLLKTAPVTNSTN